MKQTQSWQRRRKEQVVGWINGVVYHRRLLILVMFLTFATVLSAQSGCTDIQALNFDQAAMTNDGSCLYPFTQLDPPLLGNLPDLLKESSGLEWIDGRLYTHSDEGAVRLYEINPVNGEILRTVTLLGGLQNEDWEDLAESADHLFIGDFGNNDGNRKDLKIYRVNKSDLLGSAAFAQVIEFSYADQLTFDSLPNNHNFDCEAMVFWNDSLHLFSKNWVDNQTRHYVLPNEPGTQVAVVRDVFEAVGLITAADIGAEGVIGLLGRTGPGSLFCWLLYDYPEGAIFDGNKRRIFLGNDNQKGQMEGLTFAGEGEVFISAEEKNGLPARLYSFQTADWTGVPVATTSLDLEQSPLFNIAPNPFTDHLQVYLENPTPAVKIQCYDLLGHLLFSQQMDTPEASLSLDSFASKLSPGCYFLEVVQEERRQVKKIIKR